MTHDQKVALARIISDLIKADNIIEEDEMTKLAELDDRYNIKANHKIEAQQCSFTWSLNILKELSKREKKDVYSQMCGLSRSDGSCVPREALLLLAMKYSFDSEMHDCVKTFSCDLRSTNLNDHYIVYVEGEPDKEYNKEIKEELDDICDILNNCGMDFVYVPFLREEFKKMNKEYVRNVITYMAPHLLLDDEISDNQTKIDKLYNELLNVDTVKFCRNLLYKKIGVKEMAEVAPSILINIGTSLEPFCGSETKVYTEFLCIELKDSIKKEIRKFTEDYRRTLSTPPTPKTRMATSARFKYFGFYKALFDLIVFSKQAVEDSKVIIDFDNHHIVFEGTDNPILNLKPKPLSTYALILEETLCKKVGGLEIKPNDRKKAKLQDTYTYFYEHAFNMYREENDYSTGLKVSVSNIKKAITTQYPNLLNLEMYLPVKTEDGRYRINIDSNLVFVKENDNEVPIADFFSKKI